jgi:RNA polymerase sigma factor (sigma-70 family)
MASRLDSAGEYELLRASVNEPAAYEELYRRHAAGMRRWLAGQLGEVSTANELLAETFAAGWLGRRRFSGGDDRAALGWLYGIARNLLHQHYKRGRIESKARKRLGMRIEVAAEDESEAVLSRADASAASEHLNRAFESLSSGQRVAVNGRVVRELSYEELADELGCSEQSARARVSRALRALNTILKEKVNAPDD